MIKILSKLVVKGMWWATCRNRQTHSKELRNVKPFITFIHCDSGVPSQYSKFGEKKNLYGFA